MQAPEEYNGLEVAIIGMSGQFPDAYNCRDLWQSLKAGKELIKTFTDQELRDSGVAENLISNRLYIRSAGVVPQKDCFDASFFGYTNEEASLMDPQIRLFHEHCWKALEDANCTSAIETTKIGLFAGAAANDNWKIYAHTKATTAVVDPLYLNMVSSQRFLCTLVSYKLNLRGPSVYVDTACSTSLVSVHLACRSLLTRECSIALAGGVGLSTVRTKGYLYREGIVNSSDGHNRTFDAKASGTGAGEGIGVVVLKRLSEAIKDQDHIYAIVKATAVNNDGNLKVGFTAPSVKGQVECLKAAQKLAGIDPKTISYIEAHGTATPLGDPIEMRSLTEAFGPYQGDKFCAIGSIKSNMGHLDAAAGVAGLIKTALCLENKQIPASIHFDVPNPEIDFANSPFYVNTTLNKWDRRNGLPLRAGINSFGIGGTNAHAIVEESPILNKKNSEEHGYKLVTISAKTSNSILRYVTDLKAYLTEENISSLTDLSHTLSVGRKHFAYRSAFVYQTKEDLIRYLDTELIKDKIVKSKERKTPIIFMFSGVGSQYINMGRDLYETHRGFKEELDKGFAVLTTLTGKNFKDIFYPSVPENSTVNDIMQTQPALFIFEYALTKLVMEYGILPTCMIGHSVGEYVAACLSGVFTYEDALKLVLKRGELMSGLPQGAMISVAITEEEAISYLSEEVSLASINAKDQVVFSGETNSINKLTEKLQNSNIPVIKLHTSYAGHSHVIDIILEDYRKELMSVSMSVPKISFISSLTGKLISSQECTSVDYWLQQMRQTVKFNDGVKYILSNYEKPTFIEIGVGNSLTSLLKQQRHHFEIFTSVNLIRHPKEYVNDVKYLTERLGQLWAAGIPIDWSAHYKGEVRHKISLPTYSFEPIQFPTEVEPTLFQLKGDQSKVEINKTSYNYSPTWKRTTLYVKNSVQKKRTILLFSLDNSFASLLSKTLIKCENTTVIEINAAETYSRVSMYNYLIDPTKELQISQLISQISNDNLQITDIIYSWGMTTYNPQNEPIPLKTYYKFDYAYQSLVKITQTVLALPALKQVRMIILTNSANSVLGNEKISPIQSLLTGFTKVLPQETQLSCYQIDVNLQENINYDRINKLIIQEIEHNTKLSGIVAIRNGQRWEQDFEELEINNIHLSDTVVKTGVYLLTGGLSKIGFALAKYLIEQCEAKVILVGNKDILVDDGLDQQIEWRKRLNYLNTSSTNALYFNARVSSKSELDLVIATAEAKFGRIKGAIYIPNTNDYEALELIGDISHEKISSYISPIVEEITCLNGIFQLRKVDFIWVVSSISSILGGIGSILSSSANNFLDAFVSSKLHEEIQWKNLVVDELLSNDPNGGIDNTTSQLFSGAEELASLLKCSMLTYAGQTFLQSTIPIEERIQAATKFKESTLAEVDTNSKVFGKQDRPELSTVFVQPETETEIQIKELFEKFFEIENIGIIDNFFELGGDSLKAMMMLKRINQKFKTNLVIKDLFQEASIKGIAKEVDRNTSIDSDVELINEITI